MEEDGLAVLRRLGERQPELVVIMLTAYGTVPTVVEAMQIGAADFLRKPFDVEDVTFTIARALERRAMQQELTRLPLQQHAAAAFETLTGSSVAWNRVLEQAQHVAAADQNALCSGEVGSGRTALARAIHCASARPSAPLVELDLTLYHHTAQRGFHIHKSHLTKPERLARLLLATSLAYLWVHEVAMFAHAQGWVTQFHRTDRCDLSLFQIGLRAMHYARREGKRIPMRLRLPTDPAPAPLDANGFSVR